MKGLKTMSNFAFGNTSKERMIGVDKDLVSVAELALKLTKIDFGIPQYGGLRTAEEQRRLFDAGKSEADGVTNKSYHQTGKALDFYAIDPDTGSASWEPGLLAQVAAAFLQAAIQLEAKIEWGGLWVSFVDMPHVQISEDKGG